VEGGRLRFEGHGLTVDHSPRRVRGGGGGGEGAEAEAPGGGGKAGG
jgi:hypothetical protein